MFTPGLLKTKYDWSWTPDGVPSNTVNILNPELFSWFIDWQSADAIAAIVEKPGNIGGGLLMSNKYPSFGSGGNATAYFETVVNQSLVQSTFVDGCKLWTVYEIFGNGTSGDAGWTTPTGMEVTNVVSNLLLSDGIASSGSAANSSTLVYNVTQSGDIDGGNPSPGDRIYLKLNSNSNLTQYTTSFNLIYAGVEPPP